MSVIPPDPVDLQALQRAANHAPLGPFSQELRDLDRVLDRPLSEVEYQHFTNPDVLASEWGLSDAEYRGAQQIMGGGNPFTNMPAPESRRELYETISWNEAAVTSDSSDYLRDAGHMPSWGPSSGYHYRNLADSPMPFTTPNSQPGTPSFMSEIPTSTTNPDRPRTVGAGYDKERQCLTVVFRDGTYYNYYEVNGLEWANFKRARSKGRYIYTHLDQKPRGACDVASLPSEAREALFRIARTAQVKLGGYTGNQSRTSTRGGRGSYRKGNLGGTGRARNKRTGS